MLDVQMAIQRLDHAQGSGYMVQYQTDAALGDLAFWSNPAWLDTARCLLSTAAATQWVLYHRTCIDLKKVTASQLIGSVSGIIPNSKLAKYGDCSYSMDDEDLYHRTRDVTIQCDKNDESTNSRSHFCLKISKQGSSNSAIQREDSDMELKRIKSWMKKVENALGAVDFITNGDQLFDCNATALLKLCLRFISAAGTNDSLINTMNTEIAFITDYEQNQRTPISLLELQSIPQPEADAGRSLNHAIDVLWVKLSSKGIRKLWKGDAKASFPFNPRNEFKHPLIPLMKTNFLRRRHQTNKESEAHHFDIPKNVQLELLGSLLDMIEETSLPSGTTPNDAEVAPDATRTWTRRPHHKQDLKPVPEKGASMQRATMTGLKAQVYDSTAKAEPKSLMPAPFYKFVPPPILAPAMRLPPPLRSSPCAYYQNRSNDVFIPANINTTVHHTTHQVVHFQVPKVPVTYISSSKYVPSSTVAAHWNNCLLQRLNASVQVVPSVQYSRMTVPTLFYQQQGLKDVTEVRNPKTNEKNFSSGNSSRQCEEVLSARRGQFTHEGIENQVPNFNNWSMNNFLVQTPNYESNSSTIVNQNRGYPFMNRNAFQPAIHNKYLQHVKSNNCSVKSTPQLQLLHESATQTKMNRALMNYRLAPQVMHYALPRNQTMAQFALKPNFGGAPAVNGMKQVQDRMMLERHKYNEINRQLHQATQRGIYCEDHPLNGKSENHGYEGRVETWLQAVNKYMKSGSCLKSEELSGKCQQLEISIDSKLGAHGKEHTGKNKKNKSKSVRKLLTKQLELSGKYGMKLKKCRNLESKIKVIKAFLAEIDLENYNPMDSRHRFKSRQFTKRMLRNKCAAASKKQIKSLKQGACLEFKMESKTPKLFSESYFDVMKRNIDRDYKVVVLESYEYNAFPSKRTKLSNSKYQWADDEVWTQNELYQSLNHFDKVIGELFFSKNQVGNSDDENETKSVDFEMINGWAHFKITVKSVLKNIISSLDKQSYQR